MTRLLIAELRRAAARRLVRVTVVVACLGIVIGGVVAFVATGSVTETAYRQRVREADTRQRAAQAEIEACLSARGVGSAQGKVPDDVAQQCFRRAGDPFQPADDPRFHRSRLRGLLQGVSGVLAIVGWALGASLVGAEFASRGMTTLLTWETRRTRVFLAKSLAAIAASAFVALVVLTLVAVAMVPALTLHGAPLRPDDPSVASLAGIIGRGTALTAIAAGIGFAIATIGRNTAAALGAGFAYIIILENILGSSVERWRRWLLLGNVIVFVAGENNGGDVPGRTVTTAGLFLAAVTLTWLVAAAGAFRTRDLA